MVSSAPFWILTQHCMFTGRRSQIDLGALLRAVLDLPGSQALEAVRIDWSPGATQAPA